MVVGDILSELNSRPEGCSESEVSGKSEEIEVLEDGVSSKSVEVAGNE
jgi:hypothetical protein